jgi:4-aminobutyrate aminotransferase
MEMTTNQDWKRRKDEATPRGVSVMCDFYAARADNAELWDIEGRRFIDFASGIAVLNTGHRHPRVTAAIAEQLQRFTHTAYQVVPYPAYVELAERINQLAPGKHAKKTAFFTTGAEAVENAVKIARAATGRSGVIAFSGGFHGRTMMGMALTGKVDPYKLNFGPFPGEVFHAPFPNALHGISADDSIAAIQRLFKADIDPRRVAAIILEPVQGEGGFHVAPEDFMVALRALCDQHGILLIADEIQTGFARTGRMFAMDHYPVAPDLMTIAKSLAGGLPLAGVCGRAELMDAAAPGGLGGTYAGNPLAVAAAHAVLDVIEDEQLCTRAAALGGQVMAFLTAMAQEVPEIAEVRGVGAMIAAEFNRDGRPSPEFARKVQAHALREGLILLTCGNHGNVIRFLFPLTIGTETMDEALQKLRRALLA